TGQFELAWAVPEYRIVPLPASICPSVEPLTFDPVAYVVPGLGANHVRAAPDVNAVSLGQIGEAEWVELIDTYNVSAFNSPSTEVCSGGIRWREIIFGDYAGWTAEAQDDTYFLYEGLG